jgi:hypothetical protein
MRPVVFAFALTLAAGLALALAAGGCDPDLTVQGGGAPTPEGGAPGTPPSHPASDADAGDGDGGGADADTDGGGSDAGKAHVVDGVNDFASGDRLPTTSSTSGYYGYVTWDDKNVYFGMEGPDVASSTTDAGKKWVMLYLGAPGVPGSSTGLPYDCSGGCASPAQQPSLPFSAAWHVRFKVDGSYTNVQTWSDAQQKWADAGIAIVPTVGREGTFLEVSLPRASLAGLGDTLDLHMNMLIEDVVPPGWTYAGVPSTSFTDMADPDFGAYYELDLANPSKAPSAYAPKP